MAIFLAVLVSWALIAVTLVHGQKSESRLQWTTAADLPPDPGTNDLARVRIVSGGKILRASELVRKARELMDQRSDLDKDVKRNMMMTVYADGEHTNLCWIGFSAGIGKKAFSVHFDRTGKVVSERVAFAVDQVGPDKP